MGSAGKCRCFNRSPTNEERRRVLFPSPLKAAAESHGALLGSTEQAYGVGRLRAQSPSKSRMGRVSTGYFTAPHPGQR